MAAMGHYRSVYQYYQNYLPLYIGCLNECLNFELKIGDKSCNLVVLYRSPSQFQDEFESFSDK